MTAEELRVGSIVKTLQGIGRVKTIRHTGQNGYGVVLENELSGTYIEYCEGIPLTGELLLRCGFSRDKNENYHLICQTEAALHSIHLMYEIEGKDVVGYMWLGNGDDDTGRVCLRSKHLHELQNLYFELTGKELEVKL